MWGGRFFLVASLAATVLFAVASSIPASAFPGFGEFSSALPGCAGQCHDKQGVHANTPPAIPSPPPAIPPPPAIRPAPPAIRPAPPAPRPQAECRVRNECSGPTCERIEICCD